MKRKVVNFRASLFAVIGVILGIFAFYEILFGDFYFLIVSLSLCLVFGIVTFILKRKAWKISVFVLVFIMLGFVVSQLYYANRVKNETLGVSAEITGRVTDVAQNGDGETRWRYLDGCSGKDGTAFDGRVKVIFVGQSELNLSVGDVVTVRGTMYSVYPFKSDVNSSYLREDYRYEMNDAVLISKREGKLKLDEIIRRYVYDTVKGYMPENADLAYSLITGDKDALSKDISQTFSRAGIAHLLAVSGLHVGFVVATLAFVLKKFRLPAVAEGLLVITPTVFYAYACGFTPSVMRAVIMAACSYLAKIALGKYDALTSLSWAALIILIISPFYLFDAGFQMSVLSVFGIVTLHKSFVRILTRRKLPRVLKSVLNALSISLTCSLATLFTVSANYGEIPLLGVFVNILAIPTVSVAFVICLVGLLPSFFHYALWLSDKILKCVLYFASAVSRFDFATASFPSLPVSVIVLAVWFFVIGGYVNLRKVGKIVVNSVCAVLLSVCVGLAFLPKNCQTQAFVAFGYGESLCVVSSPDGEISIVGSFDNPYAVNSVLNYVQKLKISACNLYFVNRADSNPLLVSKFVERLPIKNAYALDFSGNYQLEEYLNSQNITVVQQIKNTETGNGVIVRSVYDGGFAGVLIKSGELTVALVCGEGVVDNNFLNIISYADVYVLKNANKNYSDSSITTLSRYQSSYAYNYGANKYGNFTITQIGDKIQLSFR